MNEDQLPTSYVQVNEALEYFLTNIQVILAEQVVGLYAIGSLALGNFNPSSSDIDIVIVTKNELDDAQFDRLKQMHADFAAGSSPWANKIDAVYIPLEAVRKLDAPPSPYPQIEHGTELFKHPLEDGWVFQMYTLREYGLRIFGPEPSSLVDSIDPKEMIPAVKAIAGMWLESAQRDPSWLDWLSVRKWQVFVVQTLCRMLYSLRTGSVTSKAMAVHWAIRELGNPWDSLIERSIAAKDKNRKLTQPELDETIQFIRCTVEQAALSDGCTKE